MKQASALSSEHYQTNEALSMAEDFARFTNRNIFLTGKAGTGKTTFLYHLRQSCNKRIVVVAPTGVAAINAAGVTIHSLFQLSFGPQIPGDTSKHHHWRLHASKLKMIKSIDMIVIDEISMVRADILDSIDEFLRLFRNKHLPFGGVQMLMIGDLHQLSPVAKEEEWNLLKSHYPNPFFFSSKAWLQSNAVCIELTHIFRQRDKFFIDLLNSVRDNKLTGELLYTLNQRYKPQFNPSKDEGYITLCTHNRGAQQINDSQLAELATKLFTFSARIEGDFPPNSYPTFRELSLKNGAQVMFIKNDSSMDKLYYNGKIGRLISVSELEILVECESEPHPINVARETWKNIRYDLDETTGEIHEVELGKFEQYPLKLAWAITIHKSQGLTFDKAIIDANAAFASGQVYVALSRCRTFEGIVLSSPLSKASIKTDIDVVRYSDHNRRHQPNTDDLNESRANYQRKILFEMFFFEGITRKLDEITDRLLSISGAAADTLFYRFDQILELAEVNIFAVRKRFDPQLDRLADQFANQTLPQELHLRVAKAARYFSQQLYDNLLVPICSINLVIDNKAQLAVLNNLFESIRTLVYLKIEGLKSVIDSFDTQRYEKTKSVAEIQATTQIRNILTENQETTNSLVAHPKLFVALKTWRDELADAAKLPRHLVLSYDTMAEIANTVPSTHNKLRKVQGFGKKRHQQYAEGILTVVRAFCNEEGIPIRNLDAPDYEGEDSTKVGSNKVNPKDLLPIHTKSVELLLEGKSLEEIADLQKVALITVTNHLAQGLKNNEIEITDLMEVDRIRYLVSELVKSGTKSLNVAKKQVDQLLIDPPISFFELKWVFIFMESVSADELNEFVGAEY